MKRKIPISFLILFSLYVHSQTTDKEFEGLYKKINGRKTLLAGLNKNDSSHIDKLQLAHETFQLLDYLYDFMNDEHRLNGKGSFSFGGNETKNKNIYKIGAGISIDQGLYPYELDFSAHIQTLLNNGVFEENVSDIDISFDFHPYVPIAESRIQAYESKISELQSMKNQSEMEKENNEYLINKYLNKIEKAYDVNGLWLENYVVAKRFSDGYLGIDEKYEIGAGFIFSLFSKALTRKGMDNREEINRKPTYKFQEQDLIRCLQACAPIDNVLQLSADEIRVISDSRSRYLVANRKQYSRLRLSLLVGAFFELEKTTISNTISLNGKDTIIVLNLQPAHSFKTEIRPGLVWRPKDKYKLKIYPYIKFPMDRLKNVVTEGSYRDERIDYFIDFNASLDIQVEKRFSLSLFYRHVYDNAPRRVFIKQLDNTFVLLVAENQRTSFGMGLNFDF